MVLKLKLHYISKLVSLIFLITLISCNSNPVIKLGKISYDKNKDKIKQLDHEAISQLTKKVLIAIIEEKPTEILETINKKYGAFTDIKAKSSFDEVKYEFTSGTLHKIYWNSDDQFSKILKKPEFITMNLYYYSSEECEVHIQFSNRPSLAVMNNLIVHKIDKIWYVVRLL